MRTLSLPALVALLAAAALFELLSGRWLPPIVASHFAAGGNADGFMPRRVYLGLMLALTVGLPLLLALIHSSVRLIPPRAINLPNRDYWLAPERIAETYAYLQSQGRSFAVLLAAFLCFVHWLVVQANQAQPPHFPEKLFFAGLVLFLITLAAWMGAFVLHFRRRP